MLILEMLSEDARQAFYRSLLESLREAARSPLTSLSATERERAESLVSIDDVYLDSIHEELAYGMERTTYEYSIRGVDASGEPVYVTLSQEP